MVERTRTITVNGVPFRITGEGTDEQLAQALRSRIEADPTIFQRRIEQVGLTPQDREVLAAQARGEGIEQFTRERDVPQAGRLFIGAGRRLVELSRGLKQIFSSRRCS